ncbi:unnamed protein product [Lactuca saligna]|uniref:Uncharacterized protein n=1 Tax=Lactuca saligna TaxID=75948 RepID=A0AA35ZH50_LACSI|nr:unnamed protein product [Lactuca saligna]
MNEEGGREVGVPLPEGDNDDLGHDFPTAHNNGVHMSIATFVDNNSGGDWFWWLKAAPRGWWRLEVSGYKGGGCENVVGLGFTIDMQGKERFRAKIK